mmetsp:Transcript_15836/g.49770  ORF Transcript_15836/g.49770 Transcript_15836/m.49770 type:complete len:126 (-) Transcript_15836:46-423(-)
MALRSLEKAFEGPLRWMAKSYQAAVGAELKKYGLRYDDLLCQWRDLDFDEALHRIDPKEVELRNQRLKRAMDLSMKHTYLSKEMQAKQTPYEFYMSDMVEQVKAENDEKHALDAGGSIPYNRQLP